MHEGADGSGRAVVHRESSDAPEQIGHGVAREGEQAPVDAAPRSGAEVVALGEAHVGQRDDPPRTMRPTTRSVTVWTIWPDASSDSAACSASTNLVDPRRRARA